MLLIYCLCDFAGNVQYKGTFAVVSELFHHRIRRNRWLSSNPASKIFRPGVGALTAASAFLRSRAPCWSFASSHANGFLACFISASGAEERLWVCVRIRQAGQAGNRANLVISSARNRARKTQVAETWARTHSRRCSLFEHALPPPAATKTRPIGSRGPFGPGGGGAGARAAGFSKTFKSQ